MPQALRVHDEPRAAVHGDVRLSALIGQAVLALLHQHHERAGVVGQLDPLAHDPTLVVGVEPVVVVAVDVAQRVLVALWLELDDPHTSVVSADGFDLLDDGRAMLGVRR